MDRLDFVSGQADGTGVGIAAERKSIRQKIRGEKVASPAGSSDEPARLHELGGFRWEYEAPRDSRRARYEPIISASGMAYIGGWPYATMRTYVGDYNGQQYYVGPDGRIGKD